MYLGDQMGWYRAQAEVSALPSAELAARTDTYECHAAPSLTRVWTEVGKRL